MAARLEKAKSFSCLQVPGQEKLVNLHDYVHWQALSKNVRHFKCINEVMLYSCRFHHKSNTKLKKLKGWVFVTKPISALLENCFDTHE